MTLLVAYGSKHGSTQEVAEAVAERLRASGRQVGRDWDAIDAWVDELAAT